MALGIWGRAEEEPQKWKLGGYHTQLSLFHDSYKNISEVTKLNLLAQPSVALVFCFAFYFYHCKKGIFEGDIDLMNWNTGHILSIHRENASLLNGKSGILYYLEKLSNYLKFHIKHLGKNLKILLRMSRGWALYMTWF